MRRQPRRLGLLLAAGSLSLALALLMAATASAFPENCTSNSNGTRSCSGSDSDSYPSSFVCVAGTTPYFEDSYLPADAQNPKLTSVVFKPNPPCTGATVSFVTVDTPFPASTQRPDNKPIQPPPGKAIFRFRWTVTVPSGSMPIGDMGVSWSISWTEPASSTTGGSGGPRPDLSVGFYSQPIAELGSQLSSLDVFASCSGPSGSSCQATKVSVAVASGAADDYLLVAVPHNNPSLFSPDVDSLTGVEVFHVPSLPVGGPSFRQWLWALPDTKSAFFAPFPGPATFTATILGDGDAADDSPTAAGEDVSSTTTQILNAGTSTAASPCATKPASDAGASAAGCTIAHGHATSFAGSASGDVRKVQIAIESAGKGAHAARSSPCRALTGPSGRLQFGASTNGVCTAVRWLTVNGTKHWRYVLRHSLPPGNYVFYTRPVTPIGAPVAGFTAARQNRIAFSVR